MKTAKNDAGDVEKAQLACADAQRETEVKPPADFDSDNTASLAMRLFLSKDNVGWMRRQSCAET